MSKRTKILIVLGSIAFQLALFEAFERFHLRFEDRYNRTLHRLSVLPITRIFDVAAFEALEGSEGGEIRYDEDELGYRTVDIDYDRRRGTRFVFVGSMSMGYGTGVPAENTFPAAFGDALQSLRPDAEFEVINANRAGRSLELTLEELGESGFRRVDPDVVILGSYVLLKSYPRHAGASLEERVFGGELEAQGAQTTVKLNRMVIVSQVPHSRLWNELYSRSTLMAKLLAYLDLKMAELFPSLLPPEPASQIGYLRDLEAYLDARDIPLLIVVLPQSGGERRALRTLVNRELGEFAAQENVPLLAIEEIRPISEYTFIRRGHYSIETNRVIGEDLARWVDRVLDEDFGLR